MKALLPALPQHIRYTLLVPSPTQKGVEENIPQQGYLIAPNVLNKMARPWHHPKPAQTKKDPKVTCKVQPALRASSPHQVSWVNVFTTYIVTKVSKSHLLCPFPSCAFPLHWVQRNWCSPTAAPSSHTEVWEGWLLWLVALFHHRTAHKKMSSDMLLVKLLFIAQFLKSQWRISDSWKRFLEGAEFRKSLSSFSLQEHRISCWKL